MKGLIIGLVRFYQRHISPLKAPCCRFYPTCSSYMLQAVERFGVWRGCWLGLMRILRCSPLFRGGIDPVPEEFSFLHPIRGGKTVRSQPSASDGRRISFEKEDQ